MKNGNATERAAALMYEALDVLQRAGNAPTSPVNPLLPAKLRRKLRRSAERLRQKKTQPRYKNLHTAEELADIYERTARRDEILEQGLRDIRRISRDFGRVLEENGPAVGEALETVVREVQQSAEEQGPGSEAAQRYLHLHFLAWLGRQSHSRSRRQRFPEPPSLPIASDPFDETRYRMTAAEILRTPPPSGEPVIAIPPESTASAPRRIQIRIGLDDASWIGNFACGHTNVSTVFMMPDRKHLFVSAEGAGYIVDLKSRTLVEELGLDIAGGMRDEPLTLLIVNHNDTHLEAFGPTGRLWKTAPLGCGGFRGIAVRDDRLVGEARQTSPPGWVGFSVKLATGEVRLGGGG
jgi:hypothetical protein